MPAEYADHDRERYQGTFWEQVPLPETLPAFERFLTDDDGHLWVQQYRLERESAYFGWVFDPAGRWLREIETPAGGRVTQIGTDFILGVWTDELAGQQVRIIQLVK